MVDPSISSISCVHVAVNYHIWTRKFIWVQQCEWITRILYCIWKEQWVRCGNTVAAAAASAPYLCLCDRTGCTLTGSLDSCPSFNSDHCPACLPSTDKMRLPGILPRYMITLLQRCVCFWLFIDRILEGWWHFYTHARRYDLINLRLHIGYSKETVRTQCIQWDTVLVDKTVYTNWSSKIPKKYRILNTKRKKTTFTITMISMCLHWLKQFQNSQKNDYCKGHVTNQQYWNFNHNTLLITNINKINKTLPLSSITDWYKKAL